MVDKSQVTYKVAFVGESMVDTMVVIHESVVGVEAVIALGLAYMDDQWVGERTPELYGEIHAAGVAAINSLRDPGVFVVAAPVQYGALVIC